MSGISGKKVVVRYDVTYWDDEWNELQLLKRSMITAHELIRAVDEFNQANQAFLRSGDIVPNENQQSSFITIGAVYVEI